MVNKVGVKVPRLRGTLKPQCVLMACSLVIFMFLITLLSFSYLCFRLCYFVHMYLLNDLRVVVILVWYVDTIVTANSHQVIIFLELLPDLYHDPAPPLSLLMNICPCWRGLTFLWSDACDTYLVKLQSCDHLLIYASLWFYCALSALLSGLTHQVISYLDFFLVCVLTPLPSLLINICPCWWGLTFL